jgi:bifunctional non-homologous end joining protein LigD
VRSADTEHPDELRFDLDPQPEMDFEDVRRVALVVRTVASACSVRPVRDARVSCPLDWEEVADVGPSDLSLRTVPQPYAARGDPGAGIDRQAHRLDGLLELAERDQREGLGDAPWPPRFPKADLEPARLAPSRVRRACTE